jgi:hypothetical protein
VGAGRGHRAPGGGAERAALREDAGGADGTTVNDGIVCRGPNGAWHGVTGTGHDVTIKDGVLIAGEWSDLRVEPVSPEQPAALDVRSGESRPGANEGVDPQEVARSLTSYEAEGASGTLDDRARTAELEGRLAEADRLQTERPMALQEREATESELASLYERMEVEGRLMEGGGSAVVEEEDESMRGVGVVGGIPPRGVSEQGMRDLQEMMDAALVEEATHEEQALEEIDDTVLTPGLADEVVLPSEEAMAAQDAMQAQASTGAEMAAQPGGLEPSGGMEPE